MSTLIWIAVGAVVAIPFVALGRRDGSERLFAAGLAVAALIYCGFVVAEGVSGKAAVLEGSGAVAFVVLAIAGRRSPRLLAAGWAAHAIWDMAFHAPTQAAYWPSWYPAACLGFDFVVAAYLGRVARDRE